MFITNLLHSIPSLDFHSNKDLKQLRAELKGNREEGHALIQELDDLMDKWFVRAWPQHNICFGRWMHY